jgi:hypothetical protein
MVVIFFIDIHPLTGKINVVVCMDYEYNGKLSLHWLLLEKQTKHRETAIKLFPGKPYVIIGTVK